MSFPTFSIQSFYTWNGIYTLNIYTLYVEFISKIRKRNNICISFYQARFLSFSRIKTVFFFSFGLNFEQREWMNADFFISSEQLNTKQNKK
ncbi:hypothetical protein QTP88_024388 [Uroleucon formosanum]